MAIATHTAVAKGVAKDALCTSTQMTRKSSRGRIVEAVAANSDTAFPGINSRLETTDELHVSN